MTEKTATSLETRVIDWVAAMRPEQLQKLMESGIFEPLQLSNFIEILLTIEEALEERVRKAGVSPDPIDSN